MVFLRRARGINKQKRQHCKNIAEQLRGEGLAVRLLEVAYFLEYTDSDSVKEFGSDYLDPAGAVQRPFFFPEYAREENLQFLAELVADGEITRQEAKDVLTIIDLCEEKWLALDAPYVLHVGEMFSVSPNALYRIRDRMKNGETTVDSPRRILGLNGPGETAMDRNLSPRRGKVPWTDGLGRGVLAGTASLLLVIILVFFLLDARRAKSNEQIQLRETVISGTESDRKDFENPPLPGSPSEVRFYWRKKKEYKENPRLERPARGKNRKRGPEQKHARSKNGNGTSERLTDRSDITEERKGSGSGEKKREADGSAEENKEPLADITPDQSSTAWKEVKIKVGQYIHGLQFDPAIELLDTYAGRFREKRYRNYARIWKKSTTYAGRFLNSFIEWVNEGADIITEGSIGGQKLIPVEASDESLVFTSKSGSVRMKKKWEEREIFVRLPGFLRNTWLKPDQKLGLAVLMYEYSFTQEGMKEFVRLYRNDVKRSFIQQYLAMKQEKTVPDRGYVLFRNMVVHPDVKEKILKGYVNYKGDWISRSEYLKKQGYVEFEGQWVTPERRKDLIARKKELEKKKKKFEPEGVINRPGAVSGKRNWSNAWTYKSDHYFVKTDISEKALHEIVLIMELLYFNYQQLFNIHAGSEMTVKVFKNRKEFTSYRQVPNATKGYFSSRREELVTYYQPGDTFNTTTVLLHEGTHQFVHYALPYDPPIWLNEGLAVYFEASVFEGRELVFGLKPRYRLAKIKKMIKNKNYRPVKRLLSLERDEFNTADYSQAWSLIYFLVNVDNHRLVHRFDRYFLSYSNTSVKLGPVQRFVHFIGMPLTELESRWKKYILSLSEKDTVDVKGKSSH